MNKKGFGIGNFIFGFIGLFVLILILVVLVPVQQGQTSANETYTLLNNVTNNTLSRFDVNESYTPVVNVAYSFIHFVLYSSFEVVKGGVKYANDNPGFINAKTLLLLVVISLAIPIVYYLFLIIIVIILLLREWYLNRKERRKRNRK